MVYHDHSQQAGLPSIVKQEQMCSDKYSHKQQIYWKG